MRGRRRSVGSEQLREALVGYGFIALPMLAFLGLFIYPMIYAFYISVHEWGALGKIASVGGENYRTLFGSDYVPFYGEDDFVFEKAIRNTVRYTAFVVPAQMALGLLMAVVVNQALRGRAFFRAAFYFPSLTSSAAITAIAMYILASDGLMNAVLNTNRAWFAESDTALESIMALNVFTTSGTMMLFYLAALQSIPTDVYEAAAIDGAKTWRTFWRITFPLLKPAHYFVAVISVIGSLKIFDQAFFVSGGTGGPNYATSTVVLQLVNTAIDDYNFGLAAAMGVVLFVFIFALTLIQRQLFGKAEVA